KFFRELLAIACRPLQKVDHHLRLFHIVHVLQILIHKNERERRDRIRALPCRIENTEPQARGRARQRRVPRRRYTRRVPFDELSTAILQQRKRNAVGLGKVPLDISARAWNLLNHRRRPFAPFPTLPYRPANLLPRPNKLRKIRALPAQIMTE